MATDIDAIVHHVVSFHDLGGKSVIHVGAGGGQLVGCTAAARSVLAVDPDPGAVAQLEAAVRDLGWEERVTVIHGEFSAVSDPADLVFFEFCLHEMDDPAAALRQAASLAPEIMVVDHDPESRWAWHTCEEVKAARSWEAVRRRAIVRETSFRATQHFDTDSDLVERIEALGEEAVARAEELSGEETIGIEMGYTIALVQGDG